MWNLIDDLSSHNNITSVQYELAHIWRLDRIHLQLLCAQCHVLLLLVRCCQDSFQRQVACDAIAALHKVKWHMHIYASPNKLARTRVAEKNNITPTSLVWHLAKLVALNPTPPHAYPNLQERNQS